MSGLEIACANRNQTGMIVRIGGEGWSLGAHEAIVKLMSGQLQLTILVNGEYIPVGIRGEGFDTYLALESDGFPLHNLTDLPSC